jgi:uncharacterized protein YuzE
MPLTTARPGAIIRGRRKQKKGWKSKMQIVYEAKTDLIYIRLDDRKQSVINRRICEDIVLDVGAGDKIVGIEILDASKHLNLEKLLPVSYRITHESAAA